MEEPSGLFPARK